MYNVQYTGDCHTKHVTQVGFTCKPPQPAVGILGLKPSQGLVSLTINKK